MCLNPTCSENQAFNQSSWFKKLASLPCIPTAYYFSYEQTLSPAVRETAMTAATFNKQGQSMEL